MKLRDYFFLSRENRTFTCKKEYLEEENPSAKVKSPRRKARRYVYNVTMAKDSKNKDCVLKKTTLHSRKEAEAFLRQLVLWETSMTRTEFERL